MRECNRITPVWAQLRPNYLQKEVHIQSPCFDTVYMAAGWTLIRFGCVSTCGSDEALRQPLSSYVWAPALRGSSHLLLRHGGGGGTNACHRRHLQLEQTELTATQLGTNVAGGKKRGEVRALGLCNPGHIAKGYIHLYCVRTWLFHATAPYLSVKALLLPP